MSRSNRVGRNRPDQWVREESAGEISEELDGRVGAVIDSGIEVIPEPTTVVDYSDGYAKAVRVGAVDPDRF